MGHKNSEAFRILYENFNLSGKLIEFGLILMFLTHLPILSTQAVRRFAIEFGSY